MRKIIFLLSWIVCAAIHAQTTVFFNALTDTDGTTAAGNDRSLSKDGVTFSTTYGNFSGIGYFLIYNYNSFTIATENGRLSKIEFTNDNASNSLKAIQSCTAGTFTSKETYQAVWECQENIQNVTFHVEGNPLHIIDLRITIEAPSNNSEKDDPQLHFSFSNATVVLGDDFTEPTLTKPDDVSVSFQSSNETLATVDATTGKVSLTGETGRVTITAASEETERYIAGSASYTISIRKQAIREYANYPNSYLMVDDMALLEPDDEILLVNTSQSITMKNRLTDQRIECIKIDENPDQSITPREGTLAVTLHRSGDFWTLHTVNGYLSAPGSNAKAIAFVPAVSDLSRATIDINENGVATILFQGDGAYNRLVCLGAEFACSNNSTAYPISIYRKGEMPPGWVDNISSPVSHARADHRIFNLHGQYLGTDRSRLPKGIYLVDGRKIIIDE